MSGSHTVPILKVLFAVLVWGASFIATKIALREVSPATVIWSRFAIGLLIMSFAVAYRKEFARVPLRELAYFSLLGFLGVAFHQWLQSTGLVTAQATTTAWIITTTPVFIAILGWFVLRERLGWMQVSGILLAALGVLLIVSKGDWKLVLQGNFGTFGDFLVAASAANWAVFSVLSRRSLKEYPASLLLFYVMLTGWILLNILFVRAKGYKEFELLTVRGWFAIGFLGVFCSGIAYVFWYDALKSLPASQVGAFLYLEPLITMVVAAVMLKEQLLLPMFIGGAVIVLGVWMVNRPKPASKVKP